MRVNVYITYQASFSMDAPTNPDGTLDQETASVKAALVGDHVHAAIRHHIGNMMMLGLPSDLEVERVDMEAWEKDADQPFADWDY